MESSEIIRGGNRGEDREAQRRVKSGGASFLDGGTGL